MGMGERLGLWLPVRQGSNPGRPPEDPFVDVPGEPIDPRDDLIHPLALIVNGQGRPLGMDIDQFGIEADALTENGEASK